MSSSWPAEKVFSETVVRVKEFEIGFHCQLWNSLPYNSWSKKWIIVVTTKSVGKCININEVFPSIKMLLCYINVCKSPQYNNSLVCTFDWWQICSNRCNQWCITNVFASYLVCTLPSPWQDETRLQLLNLQHSLRTTSDCSWSKQSSDTTILPGLRLTSGMATFIGQRSNYLSPWCLCRDLRIQSLTLLQNEFKALANTEKEERKIEPLEGKNSIKGTAIKRR